MSSRVLVLGGSVYEGHVFKERQPRVAFSPDGRTWTAPRLLPSRRRSWPPPGAPQW